MSIRPGIQTEIDTIESVKEGLKGVILRNGDTVDDTTPFPSYVDIIGNWKIDTPSKKIYEYTGDPVFTNRQEQTSVYLYSDNLKDAGVDIQFKVSAAGGSKDNVTQSDGSAFFQCFPMRNANFYGGFAVNMASNGILVREITTGGKLTTIINISGNYLNHDMHIKKELTKLSVWDDEVKIAEADLVNSTTNVQTPISIGATAGNYWDLYYGHPTVEYFKVYSYELKTAERVLELSQDQIEYRTTGYSNITFPIFTGSYINRDWDLEFKAYERTFFTLHNNAAITSNSFQIGMEASKLTIIDYWTGVARTTSLPGSYINADMRMSKRNDGIHIYANDVEIAVLSYTSIKTEYDLIALGGWINNGALLGGGYASINYMRFYVYASSTESRTYYITQKHANNVWRTFFSYVDKQGDIMGLSQAPGRPLVDDDTFGMAKSRTYTSDDISVDTQAYIGNYITLTAIKPLTYTYYAECNGETVTNTLAAGENVQIPNNTYPSNTYVIVTMEGT